MNFPYCYKISPDDYTITSPNSSAETFTQGKTEKQGITILKLHGSLNWYSVHRAKDVAKKPLFDQDRDLFITRRKELALDMKYKGERRREQTLPIIVPPVANKSSIFHSAISSLWTDAIKKLENANDVVIFGYSCPEVDHESANLLQRTLISRELETFAIIDPSPEAFTRFWELTKQERIFYFSSADSYINSKQE